MHVKSIDRKVISGEFERLEDLFKSQLCAIAEDDDVLQRNQNHPARRWKKNKNLGVVLHFRFYEPQKVLLVHATRMVNVCVDLADVVEIASE